jgi:hypothetical protein
LGGTPWLNSVSKLYVWSRISFCCWTFKATGFYCENQREFKATSTLVRLHENIREVQFHDRHRGLQPFLLEMSPGYDLDNVGMFGNSGDESLCTRDEPCRLHVILGEKLQKPGCAHLSSEHSL